MLGQGPRLGQDGGGGEGVGARGAQQSQGSTLGQTTLLWVTAVAGNRCQTWAPLRGPLSFLIPISIQQGWGALGAAGKGLAGPAHLTQLSWPRGTSLPLPTPQLGLRASGLTSWAAWPGNPALGSWPPPWARHTTSQALSLPSPTCDQVGVGRQGLMEVVPGRANSASRKPQAQGFGPTVSVPWPLNPWTPDRAGQEAHLGLLCQTLQPLSPALGLL